MAQDTIVQYVLKVDAKGAQQALDQTGKEAKDASQSFERLENSSAQAVQGLRKVETQAKATTGKARQLRRAGRDLDGAFADLGQGASALSPALGSLFFTISDGASVVEALGRGLTGFLNPAFAVTAIVAVAAGAAIFEIQREAEEAKKREEELAEITERTNKTIEQQTKAAQSAADSLISYYQEVDQARINLQLLTGQITQFEADQKAASATAQEFGQNAKEAQQEQKTALEETISARNEQIKLLRTEIGLLKEQRAIAQPLSARIAGQPQQFEESTDREKGLQRNLDTLTDAQRVDQQRLQDAQAQRFEIERQQKAYEEILLQQAQIAEQDRKRSAAEKARSARLRQEAEEQRQREQQQKEVQRAQAELQKVLEGAVFSQLTVEEQINATYEKQAENLFRLLDATGDVETANAALVELGKIRDQQLQAEIDKQQQLANKEAERAQRKAESDKKERERREKEAARAEERAAKDRADEIQDQVAKFEALVSLDASSILSLVAPVAGQLLGIVEQIGQTTPEEKREAIQAQVEAIKQGLAQLPTIFLELIPLLAFGVLEALTDGFQLLIINLIKIIKDAFSDLFSFRDRDPDGNSGQSGAREAFRRFLDPNQSASFMSGGRFIPKAQGGIRFTGMQDGLAMLHRGEFVVPQSGQRPQQVDRQLNGATGGGMTVNINSAVVDRNAVDALVRQIEIRFNNQFGTSSSNLFGGR